MKSKVLVKLVLVFLLASGIIVLLGSKALVSAQVGFGRHSNESINVQFLDVKPWWSYRLTKPNPKGLLVQPRLTSTPSVSGTVKSTGLTPLLTPAIMVVPTPVLFSIVPMHEDNKDSMEKFQNHLPKEDRAAQFIPHSYYYTLIKEPFPLQENELTIPLPNICDLEMVADGSWHSTINTPSKSQKVAKGKSQMLAQVPTWVNTF